MTSSFVTFIIVSMFGELVESLQQVMILTQQNMVFVLSVLGILWGIHILNRIVGYKLNIFGVYPRNLFGIIGIAAHPLLHGSFTHLFLNTIPLFLLMNFVLIGGIDQWICVTTLIVLISGALTWLFGRKAIHVGASTVIMGYFGYLIVSAYYNPSFMTVILSIISVYYFGGLFLSLVPKGEGNVSFEGHIFGFVAGIAAIYLCSIPAV